MTKGLSDKDLEKYRQELLASDLLFAKKLDSLQKSYFPKRLKNISEWSEAEKVKRVILGLADKHELSGPGGAPIHIEAIITFVNSTGEKKS
jgi:hypothetical protein